MQRLTIIEYFRQLWRCINQIKYITRMRLFVGENTKPNTVARYIKQRVYAFMHKI